MKGLPFPAVLPEKVDTSRLVMKSTIERMRDSASDIAEMSLDDINAEISASRKDRKNG